MANVTQISPTWANAGTIVDPPTAKKNTGWQGGDKPEHEYFNHLLSELQLKVNELIVDVPTKTSGQLDTIDAQWVFTDYNIFQSNTELQNSMISFEDGSSDPFRLYLGEHDQLGTGIASRIYFGSESKMTITNNCFWNTSTNVWTVENSSYPAWAYDVLYPSTGAANTAYWGGVYYKATSDSITTPWTDSGWTTIYRNYEQSVGGGSNEGLNLNPRVAGACYFETYGVVAARNVGADSDEVYGEVWIPWGGNEIVGVSTGDITVTTNGRQQNWSTTPILVASSVNDYGCAVAGTSDTMVAGAIAWHEFKVVVDKAS